MRRDTWVADLLLCSILVFRIGSGFGMTTETGLRIGLVLMGLWWFAFTLPAAFILRDNALPRQPAGLSDDRARRTRRSIDDPRSHPQLQHAGPLLLGFLLYNEGIQTVMSQARSLPAKSLKMEPAELAMVVLMIQFSGHAGRAWRRLDVRSLGAQATLLVCLGDLVRRAGRGLLRY